MLIVDGPFEVNLEEIGEGMIDHEKDERCEIVNEVRMTFDGHVKKVEACTFFGENLIDYILGVVLQTFFKSLAKQFSSFLGDICIKGSLPESLEIRVGLMRSNRNSVLVSGFFSQ